MKKATKVLCFALCLILCVPGFSGCKPKVLSYEGGALPKGTVGTEYAPVSVATATGSKDIAYEAVSYLPSGLSLSEAGILSGTPLESWSEEKDGAIEIAAYADGYDDVFAEFILNVDAGTFTYTGGALIEGKAGEAYSATVATATGAANSVSYALATDSVLPTGLYMSSAGMITGTPLISVEECQFTVIASSAGYNSCNATFTIKIAEGEDGPGIADEILYNAERMTIDLGEITVGGVFSADLTADQIVYDAEKKLETRYEYTAVFIAENDIGYLNLPEGLTLAATGLLTGTPKDSTYGVLTFKVRAFVVTVTNTPASISKPTLSGFVENENNSYTPVSITVTLRVWDKTVTTKRFEAEWANLTGKQGAGFSGSANGKQMVQFRTVCSEGASLGYMHASGIFIDFHIYSDVAATGTFTIRLASEVGTCTFTDDILVVEVNDVKVGYGSINIEGSGVEEQVGAFQTFSLGNINLKAGENIIRITLEENQILDGRTGGPEIDYFEINTSAALSWRPKVYNSVK